MLDYTLHFTETAPEASRPVLEATEKAWHFVPNLHRVLAEAPAALEGYTTLSSLFSKTSFTPAEQQVILMTANYENECHYCMAGHTVLARQAHLPEQAIEALRDGVPIADAKLESLRRFTATMVTQRGWASDDDVAAFLAAGYDKRQILEVILGIATKTLSNYTDHIAETPLDAFMKDTAWQHPSKRDEAA